MHNETLQGVATASPRSTFGGRKFLASALGGFGFGSLTYESCCLPEPQPVCASKTRPEGFGTTWDADAFDPNQPFYAGDLRYAVVLHSLYCLP
eukprot:s12_g15.t1